MIQPDSTHISPDGRIRIDYRSEEMRMSLWVDVPHVSEVATGRTIFAPESSLVSGEHEWGEDGQFRLYLREYPNGGSWIVLDFDIDAGVVQFDGEEAAVPIGHAARIVSRRFRAHKITMPTVSLRGQSDGSTGTASRWSTPAGRLMLAFIVVMLGIALGIYMGWLPLASWVGRALS